MNGRRPTKRLSARLQPANKTAKTIGGAVVGQILGNYIGKHNRSEIGGRSA